MEGAEWARPQRLKNQYRSIILVLLMVVKKYRLDLRLMFIPQNNHLANSM
jgi:hypothetical protein